MTQRGSGCTQRMGSELVLQHSTPSLVLPMHLCAADISQIYNSMEAVPRVLCCSKACMHVVLKIASCFMCGLSFCYPSTPVHAHLAYLPVSPLLQISPIAPTTGGVVLVLDLEFIDLLSVVVYIFMLNQHFYISLSCSYIIVHMYTHSYKTSLQTISTHVMLHVYTRICA